MTQNELNELRIIMLTDMLKICQLKDLVQYVFDDLLNYDNQPDAEFVDEAQNYWEDHYDDVVKDIKAVANSEIKSLNQLGVNQMKTITLTDDQFEQLYLILYEKS